MCITNPTREDGLVAVPRFLYELVDRGAFREIVAAVEVSDLARVRHAVCCAGLLRVGSRLSSGVVSDLVDWTLDTVAESWPAAMPTDSAGIVETQRLLSRVQSLRALAQTGRVSS